MLNTDHFFCGGGAEGEGDISWYSTVIVRLEFPQSRKQNTNSTSVQLFGRISRCAELMSLIKELPKLAEKAPLEKYFTVKVLPLCTTHNQDLLKKSCIAG